jgi:hypothetical protein
LLTSCGFAATTTASVVTGTATAGASNSITLAAAASAVNGFYTGMILRITGGTGAGTVALITNYVGSTKVATLRALAGPVTPAAASAYSIDLQTIYTPVSSSFSSVTIHYNIDGVLHRLTGCRGTFTINAEVGGIPSIDFTMIGIFNTPTDTAPPTANFGAQATPQIFKQGNSGGFNLMGFSGCLQSVSLDAGVTTVYRELVGCIKEVMLTDRAVTGSVTIEAPTIAERNFFTDALTDGSPGELSFIHGNTATNIVALYSTRVDIGDPNYADQDGIHMLTIPATLIPSTAGNDEVRLVFA